jgi:hypothetical protein
MKTKNLKAIECEPNGYIFYDESSTANDIQKGDHFYITTCDQIFENLEDDYAKSEFGSDNLTTSHKVICQTIDLDFESVPKIELNIQFKTEAETLELIKKSNDLDKIRGLIEDFDAGQYIESIDVVIDAEQKIIPIAINYIKLI